MTESPAQSMEESGGVKAAFDRNWFSGERKEEI